MNVSWKIVLLLFAVSSVYCAMTEAFTTIKTFKEKKRDRPDLVDSINRFSWNLMREMSTDQPNANLLLSPISISSVLLMLWNGAAGKTKNELEQVSGFRQGSLKDFDNIRSSVIDSSSQVGDDTTMILSNAIFFDKDLRLENKFLVDAKEYFNADIKAVDFKYKSNEAKAAINEWVKNRTLGIIEKIISGELRADTTLIITNAVYFSGKWQFPFKAAATSDKLFKTSNGTNVIVPMMRRQGRFAYRKMCRPTMYKKYKTSFMRCSVSAQPDVVEIPYENGKHSMIILIPNEYYSLKRIEEEFSQRHRLWRNSIVRGNLVQLSIPKFHVKFQSSLNDFLERAGIKTAFNSLANFNDMTKKRVAVSEFLHKTAIQVDEGGTTAAAASAAIVVLKINDVEDVIVDRTFYFFIEDLETRVQLFVGKVEDPTKEVTVLN